MRSPLVSAREEGLGGMTQHKQSVKHDAVYSNAPGLRRVRHDHAFRRGIGSLV